jgi:hypothetical protein
LKRVQSWPPATVLGAALARDEPAIAAPPLQAATTRATVITAADDTFIDTVSVYPAGAGANPRLRRYGSLDKKKPLIEGRLVKPWK